MSTVHTRVKVVAAGLGLLLGGALAVGATTAQAAPRVALQTAIVSLGDSAISGEGAGNYEPGTNGENGDWCHRSRDASIHHTDTPDIAATINLACSGANSAQVGLSDFKQYGEPSQAGRLAVIARQN